MLDRYIEARGAPFSDEKKLKMETFLLFNCDYRIPYFLEGMK